MFHVFLSSLFCAIIAGFHHVGKSPLTWKWSGPILKAKDKGEVHKKGKYKQQKKKAGYKKTNASK